MTMLWKVPSTARSPSWVVGAVLLFALVAAWAGPAAWTGEADAPARSGPRAHVPDLDAETGASAAASKPRLEPYVRPEPLRDLHRRHKVRLVYFVPKDRRPTANWSEKIAVVMTFVNDLYTRDLRSKGFATGGLDFEFQGDRPIVHLLEGRQTAAEYSGEPQYDGQRQWRMIVPEVEAAYGKAGENAYVIFVETYNEGPWKFEYPGGFALGARFSASGGVGMFSAWILRDEFCATTVDEQLRLLADETPIEGRVALHCMKMNSPRFEFIEDGFGAVAHELGHAFGLPHDRRADDVDIMGNGFRFLRNNYLGDGKAWPRAGFMVDGARFLRWSRFLADDADLSDDRPPEAVITHPTRLKVGSTHFHLGGRLTDDKGLAAMLVWSPKLDWTIGGCELAGKQVLLNDCVIVPPLEKGVFEVVVMIVDRGGNIGTVKIRMPVE